MLFPNNVPYKVIWMDLQIKGGFISPKKSKEEKIMNGDHAQAKTILFLIIQILLLTFLF